MIRSHTLNRRLALLASALMLVPQGVLANPLGGQVMGGQATIQGQGTSTVTVTQGSQNAIINWNTFNIGAGETTQFIQPNAGAIALNRVTGGQGVSTIYGHLTANGRIFLINPDGIMIGPGGIVNAAGFLASTNDIKNSDFMAGNYKFTIPGRPDASIVNLGTITASSGGFAGLVAPGVRNAGVITANLGTVALASGNGFTLDFYGDKLITLQVGDKIANQVIDVATGQPLDALVKNEGTLKANGGQVALTAAAARHVVDSVINNTGVIEAHSVGMKNGMIVLGGATAATKGTNAPTQTVKVSGTLSVSGHKKGTKGGVIQVTGEDIQVAGAKINASGQAGGGTVLIGGDTGGGTVNAAVGGVKQAQLQSWSVATASTVSIDAATVIDASAKAIGDGGKVVVWSNQATKFAGTINATGGINGGNGGFAEVSSHGSLSYTGLANLGAPKGTAGTLLFDPADVLICDDCGKGQTFDSGNLSAQLLNENVIITTGAGDGQGNITVADTVGWSGTRTLTLNAVNSIFLDGAISAANGGLTLNAGNNISATAAVNVGTFTLQGGSWSQAGPYLPAFAAHDFRITGGTFLRALGGNGSFDGIDSPGSPYQITDVYGLQGIGSQGLLNKNFVLANNIDASGTANWNGGAGFVPIGNISNKFTGTLDGKHYVDDHPSSWTISNLTIAPVDPNVTNIGLFGVNAGTIKHVELTNASITANPFATVPTQYVGTLAGQNFGLIKHVSATGTIDGGNLAGVAAGGLVGQNGVVTQILIDHVGPPIVHPGVIKHSSADVAVTIGDGAFCVGGCEGPGWNYAGGLVGINAGVVSHSSASGAVTSGSQSFAGGLVGANQNFFGTSFTPLITWSSASGNVTSSGVNVALGGLVGANGLFGFEGPATATGVIKNSHASGHVSATANANNGDCNTNPSACVSVSVGGLVGQNAGLIQGQKPSSHGDDLAFGGGAPEAVGCGMGTTCASGMVSAGAGGQAGGLVGFNEGVIKYAFAIGDVHVGSNGTGGGLVGFNSGTLWKTSATGAVTGDAGTGIGHDGGPRATSLGGLVGGNQGVISHSFATGAVGDVNVAQLNVGGLAGDNSGTIKHSFATGAVSAGTLSEAGGLAGDNSHNDFNCGGCDNGVGQNDKALISHSYASGIVTVGVESIAGGLVGGNGGTIKHSHTTSNVTGGHDSVLGGLVAFVDVDGIIKHSSAAGTVTSTGANSIVAGFAGLNGGQIFTSQASGGVNGTSNSYLGGFVGINVGTVKDSANTGTVTGTGGGNVAGGFVSANAGLIDNSSSTGQVSSGPNSIVGGFVGGNLSFANLPSNLIAGSPFPVGIITNSTIGTGTTQLTFVSLDAAPPATTAPTTTNDPAPPPFTGSTDTTGYPGLPAVVAFCSFCGPLVVGLQPPPPPSSPPDNGTPTFNQPVYQQVGTPPTDPNSTPIQINLNTGGPGLGGGTGGGGNGGNGNGNGGVKPNYGPPPGPGLGRTADEQQYSGVPPPGETRFRTGELVIQVVDTIPIDQVVATAQKFGFVLISTQHLDQTHRNVFRFRATGTADLRKLIPMWEKLNIVASVQPNYNFVTAQAAPAPAAPPASTDQTNSIPPAKDAAPDLANSDTASLQSLPAGDAAQYVIDKFHLGAVHRLASGRNVIIAVIDSEIDATHPDLRGSIIERYDATQTPSKPHPHGTGMAGAIVSRARLLGVAPGARILAIKAFDESANSAEATSFQILKGLDYAIAKNVRIINMSFAGPRDPMMERTLKSAHDKGIILIAAAGNAGPKSPPLYPGADPSVIAVSATDYSDKPFTMANRGKYIAVAAPGVDVMVPAPANSYQLTTGTSVAAAHVSGVAALILERKPTITPDELRALLMKTSTAFSAKPKGEEDGAGLVDPVGALQALAGAKTSETPSRSPVAASVR